MQIRNIFLSTFIIRFSNMWHVYCSCLHLQNNRRTTVRRGMQTMFADPLLFSNILEIHIRRHSLVPILVPINVPRSFRKNSTALLTDDGYEILLFIHEIYYRPNWPNKSNKSTSNPRVWSSFSVRFSNVFSRPPVAGLIYRSSTFY